VRVLDLTRILAGPVAGRTLAAYGADVLLVNSPALPNIEAVPDVGRGKLSAHLDLRDRAGQDGMQALLETADVFLQGYRPGSLEALGFGDDAVAARHPGIVYASLSAWGPGGPWRMRRGFDSLVQTASGFNLDEAEAAGSAAPKPLPTQILDHASGYLLAFGIQAALVRRAAEGGSWHVQVSLAQTARWLRAMGRIAGGLDLPDPTRVDVQDLLETTASGFGALTAVRHAARLEETPAGWQRPSVPVGASPAQWPTN
jgi:crotonobetainyl-CoA:carnitine CoA-transferase CaiB-like acyl-CoA transferase